MHTIIQGIYNVVCTIYHDILSIIIFYVHIDGPGMTSNTPVPSLAVACALCSHRYKQVINTALEIVSNTLVNKQIVVSPGQAV